MSQPPVITSVSSVSYFPGSSESEKIKPRKPIVGFLDKIEIPRLPQYKCDHRVTEPCIIGRNIQDLVTSTGFMLDPHASGGNETKILGRVGLERFGRFQHGQVIYQVQRSTETGSPIHEVTSEHIADYVTLQELERFENSQFEQELVFEDSSVANRHQKRRGRPPKAALDNLGISSDDEIESDVLENGVTIVIPKLNSRKRPRSLSPVRARGRPRKIGNSNSVSTSKRFSRRDGLTFDHVALPQVKNRAKKARGPWNSSTASHQSVVDVQELIDEGSNQLIWDDDVANQSQFKTSSALVAAAALPSQSQSEDPVALHRQPHAKKPGRGRPRKNLPLQTSHHSEDTDLETLHERFKVRKPQTPRKDTQPLKTIENEFSSTEDELSTIHQQFGVVSPNAAKSPAVSRPLLSITQDQQKRKSNPSKSRLANPKKPGPGSRLGYNAPTLRENPDPNEAPSTTSSESSSASSTRLPAGVPSAQQNRHAQTIEIFDDDSDNSPVVASAHLKATPTRTPRPSTQSKGTSSLNNSVRPTSSTSDKVVKPAESDSEDGPQSESSDEDEDTKALDFQIPDISSSQSYVAAKSETSDSEHRDGEEQTIRQTEAAKRQLLARTVIEPGRQLSSPNKTQDSRPTPSVQIRRQNDRAPNTAQSRPASSTQHQRRKRPPSPSKDGRSSDSDSTTSSSEDSPDDPPSAAEPSARHPPPKAHQANLTARTKGKHAPSAPTQKPVQRQPSRPAGSSKHPKQPANKSDTHHITNPTKSASVATSRPFLPFATPGTKPKPTPHAHQSSSSLSPSDSAPSGRQSSISLGERDPEPAQREASISLGESSSHEVLISSAHRGSTVVSKTAAFEVGTSKVGRPKKRIGQRVSMTPLFPGRNSTPGKKGRKYFSTREFMDG